ncbi:threonine aldolase family protein [Rhodocista pekingensis]|uniref:L-threonine aldolase n=1 Tax=Rhodocista pekingensis TaxID=201185 RepID=A0ABW2KTB9_9PROT
MNFMSDNVSGAAPEILAALNEVSAAGAMPSYGADPVTARLDGRMTALFGTPVTTFPVATGTAANALALSVLTPPYGAVYCHAEAHINVDECGAPEMFTSGAKLIPLPGAHGKLTPQGLADALARAHVGFVHAVQPAALSLTQVTEAGTVYTPDEVAALCAVAKRHGLKVHMDGARFANAVASLGCDPAEVTWRAGVDVLSFGATKNGALAAEAVVFFDRALAESFGYRRKRAGHLFSKMRFLSAQLDAYLTDGLWLRLAGHANAMAQALGAGLAALPGASLRAPVEANEVFVELPEAVTEGLLERGFQFYRWDGAVVRLVTAWNTQAGDVAALVAAARELASGAPADKGEKKA